MAAHPLQTELRSLLVSIASGNISKMTSDLKVSLRVANRAVQGKGSARDRDSINKLKQTLKIEESLLESLEKVPSNPELDDVLKDMRERIRQTKRWIGQARLLQLVGGG